MRFRWLLSLLQLLRDASVVCAKIRSAFRGRSGSEAACRQQEQQQQQRRQLQFIPSSGWIRLLATQPASILAPLNHANVTLCQCISAFCGRLVDGSSAVRNGIAI